MSSDLATAAALDRVAVNFFSGDDGKDYDSRLDVRLFYAGNEVANATSFGTEFKQHESITHYFPSGIVLRPTGAALPPESAWPGCTARLEFTPNGNDTWWFDFHIKLWFSSGTVVKRFINGQVLSQDGDKRVREYNLGSNLSADPWTDDWGGTSHW
jgi:hypothetical protein